MRVSARGMQRLLRGVSLIGLLVPVAAQAQSSPSAFTSATRYDAERRVTGTIAPDPDGSGSLRYAAVRNTYDAAGRLTKVEKGELAGWQSEAVAPKDWTAFTVQSQIDTTYDAGDRKLTETMSAGGTAYALTQYSYDLLGRLQCTAVRMNAASWGSLPASACAPGTPSASYGPDRITRQSYDAAGQLIQVDKAYGITTANGYAATQQQTEAVYGYSLTGKRASVTDGNGNVATMSYDGHDRLAQWNFPDKTTTGQTSTTDYEAYSYDANGNRTSLRKRDGRMLSYSYDALNRMTSKVVPDGGCPSDPAVCTNVAASATRDVYYSYDLRGLQTAARFDGASGTDAVVSAYNGFGELTGTTTAMGGVSRQVSHSYDADGNRLEVTWPDALKATFAYDGLDRLEWVYEGTSATLAHYGYTATLQPYFLSRVSGLNTIYNYDPAQRLIALAHDFTGTARDLTIGLAYNPAGQIVSRSHDNDAYASTSQTNADKSYAVNGLNQYPSVAGATHSYDADGNLTGDGANAYVYDAENRLVAVSGAHNATLSYDPLGRLFQVQAGSSTRQLLYDGDELVGEYAAGGTMTARYIHRSGSDDPIVWYAGSVMDATTRRFLHADQQGSIVAVSDASGNAIAANCYDEYGMPNATNLGTFQYTGQAWLPELGLYHYKARLYAPALGRFLQTDPVGYADQLNLYAYVGNDPVDLIDSDGQRAATAGEARLLHNAFGGALDSQASYPLLIMNASLTTRILSGGRSFNGPMGVINFSQDDYKEDFSEIDISKRGAFYHEFWHRFEITIGKSRIEGLLLNQIAGGFGNGIYSSKSGVTFWKQNPEARADIFSNAMVTGNFSAMVGVSGNINSTTTFKFDKDGINISENVTGSRIPKVTRYDKGVERKE